MSIAFIAFESIIVVGQGDRRGYGEEYWGVVPSVERA